MKSPIFQIINAFLINEEAFKGRIFLKTTKNADRPPTQYYLIKLPVSRESLTVGDKTWKLDHHHISVYEEHTQSESHYTSAYHYTGTFTSGDTHIIVHAYFDREGNYLNCHLKDDNGKSFSITPSDETKIRSYAELASIEMISRIQQKAVAKAKEFKLDFDKAIQQLEQLSTELAKETPEAIQQYLTQLNVCLEMLSTYGKYTYEPLSSIEQSFIQTKAFLTAKLENKQSKNIQVETSLKKTHDSKVTSVNSPPVEQEKKSKSAKRKAQRTKKRSDQELNKEYEKLLSTPRTPQRLIQQYEILKQRIASAESNELDIISTVLQKMTALKNEISEGLISHALHGDAKVVVQLAPYVETVPYELYFACTINGHIEVMEVLVNHYKFNLNQLNLFPSGQFDIGHPSESLLHVAIDANQENMLIWLLKKGANPNITAPLYGETALTRAVKKTNKSFTALLLEYHANPNLPEVASTIFDTRNRGFTITISAATPRKQETPLHIAVRLQLPEIVSLLLAHGARTDVITTDSFTPFMMCFCHESNPLHQGVVECFLARGAHIDERHPLHRYTGLYYACNKGRFADVIYLVEHGADPNNKCKTINGEEYKNKLAPFINEIFTGTNEISITPLINAAVSGHINIVGYLISQTQKPVTVENIYHAYMLATIHEQHECARILFERYRSLIASNSNTDALLSPPSRQEL